MLITLVKLQYYRACKGFIILLNNNFKQLGDLNHVTHRLKHTMGTHRAYRTHGKRGQYPVTKQLKIGALF